MGIDKETELSYTLIGISKNPKLLKQLEENHTANVGEKEHNEKPEFWFNDNIAKIKAEEYYFDEKDCEINFCGSVKTLNGDIYLSFVLPITDTVLIDILQASIKRLNKLKTALETLR